MEASAVSVREAPSYSAAASRSRALAVPWYLYAALFAATSVVVGVVWDISWHMTIGRDSFWTPAHMAIYVGGIVAGFACGWLVLRTSFSPDAPERAASVSFWHFFRAPLGAWVCVWGAFAMITSAPFDDWWHNAYGLDVQILSPPHTVLALGIQTIVAGALLMMLARQNRTPADDPVAARYRVLVAYALGLILVNVSIMAYEFTERISMHSSSFYRVTCALFPVYLVAATRASRLRWPATSVAGVYTVAMLAQLWLLPLFPAEAKLAPIFQPVTRMVPMDFPLLLLVPAIAIDLVVRHFGATERNPRRDWLVAAALGAVFFVAFLAVQWPFADFLMSDASKNWVFNTTNYPYSLPKATYMYRHAFYPRDDTLAAARAGMLWALLFAMIASRAGLAVGGWLRGVRR